MHKLKIYTSGLARNALSSLIRFYQIFISPNFRKNCRFWPSCSQYVHQAIEKHGAFKGSRKGIWRILKCNPFNKGGIDLP